MGTARFAEEFIEYEQPFRTGDMDDTPTTRGPSTLGNCWIPVVPEKSFEELAEKDVAGCLKAPNVEVGGGTLRNECVVGDEIGEPACLNDGCISQLLWERTKTWN